MVSFLTFIGILDIEKCSQAFCRTATSQKPKNLTDFCLPLSGYLLLHSRFSTNRHETLHDCSWMVPLVHHGEKIFWWRQQNFWWRHKFPTPPHVKVIDRQWYPLKGILSEIIRAKFQFHNMGGSAFTPIFVIFRDLKRFSNWSREMSLFANFFKTLFPSSIRRWPPLCQIWGPLELQNRFYRPPKMVPGVKNALFFSFGVRLTLGAHKIRSTDFGDFGSLFLSRRHVRLHLHQIWSRFNSYFRSYSDLSELGSLNARHFLRVFWPFFLGKKWTEPSHEKVMI